MLEGSGDTEAFRLYLEQAPGPALQPGDIVMMDNLSVFDLLPPPNAIGLWREIPTLSAVAHFS